MVSSAWMRHRSSCTHSGWSTKTRFLENGGGPDPGIQPPVKVSEGCDNPCSFCAIPLMRGLHRSQPLEQIVAEATKLADDGVRELVLIGQDTTAYGLDLYGRRRLADVLAAVADVPGIEWVRLMYAYPSRFPEEILQVIAEHPHICKYLDIPIQHAADPVLRSMRRGISARALRELLGGHPDTRSRNRPAYDSHCRAIPVKEKMSFRSCWA